MPHRAADVPLEFVTWFVWLGVFAVLQHRLCLRHPGIRTVCRLIYAATALVPVVPAVWTLAEGVRNVYLLARVNHAFGMGVLAQTSLRALLLVRWLAWPGAHAALRVADQPRPGMATEVELLALLASITGAVREVRSELDQQ